jgi:hypothetical protein
VQFIKLSWAGIIDIGGVHRVVMHIENVEHGQIRQSIEVAQGNNSIERYVQMHKKREIAHCSGWDGSKRIVLQM